LRSAAGAEILPPDDAVLAAVLVKQFSDRQLVPPASVISYLLSRMERSFAAARTIVDQLDRASLGAGRPITLNLARRTLAAMAEQ
jgi:chromosomal replication initiation ATPase DnaA